MNLLAATLYDPAGAVTKATSSNLALTAFDTTNLRLRFSVPPSGRVRVRMQCNLSGATTMPQIMLGILDGSTVKGRQVPLAALPGTAVATTNVPLVADFIISGLTPGTDTNYDAAYAVETAIASTNIHYGGPNNTTSNDAWGGFAFEIWDPSPIYAPAANGVPPTASLADTSGRVDVAKFAGSALTQSGGRPEVNTSHIAGSAVSTTSAQIGVNVVQISTDATAADNAEAFFDGTGYAGTGNTIPTVTTVNGLAAGVITASSIAADAITAAKIADGAIDAATFAASAITATVIAADAITAAKIANGAIDAATFAADVDAEILSYIVDDATRIDASALNTLSSHDPGEAIMGATDLGTGAGLTSLASAANLAIVDGIVDDILVDTSTTLQGELDGIQADTEDIQTRLPAALVSGRIDASVGAIAANAITATSIANDAITAAKIANAAIDAATFAADVDAEILSYLVDDATRIDASALNTLSAHDPGETIMGATDLGTGAGLTALASAADLATVAGYLDTEIAAIKAKTDNLPTDPADASDIAASFALLNTKVDTIDGIVDDILAADVTGAVVDDAANTAASFLTTLTETADDHWKESFVKMTSGDLLGQVRLCSGYNGTTKVITVSPAFTAEPDASDTFDIVNE